jgi:flagellar biosynthesis/type III secretory pathway chaperone
MPISWESELAHLLNELLALQDELLAILSRKRQLLTAADAAGLAAIAPEEETLIDRLQRWVRRREELLARAAQEGLPKASLRALTGALPSPERDGLDERVQSAAARARLLRHHALTNWVVVQRTLIHLSQMLEIIATGGRLQPTYGGGAPDQAGGALVDRAV